MVEFYAEKPKQTRQEWEEFSIAGSKSLLILRAATVKEMSGTVGCGAVVGTYPLQVIL